MRELSLPNQQLVAVFDSLVDAVIIMGEDRQILAVNRAATDIFEYTESELIGRNINVLMSEADAAKHDEHVQRYLAGGEARIIGVGREVVARRKSGDLFPADLAVSEVVTEEGWIFTGILRDISLNKYNAILQHDCNTMLKLVIGGSPLPQVLSIAIETCKQILPHRYVAILVTELVDDCGNHFADNLGLGLGFGEQLANVMTGGPDPLDPRTIDAQPLLEPLMAEHGLQGLVVHPALGADGRVVAWVIAFSRQYERPTTSFAARVIQTLAQLTAVAVGRREAQNELETALNRYRALVDTTGAVIVVVNQALEIVDYNLTAARLWGWARRSRGHALADHLSIDRKSLEEAVTDALEHGSSAFEAAVRRASAERVPTFVWNVRRMGEQNRSGEEPAVLLVGQDISDRVDAQEALRALHFEQAQLERIALTGEMAAMVAHEVRTPLNALAINVQMIERTVRRVTSTEIDGVAHRLQALRGEIQRINELVDDYLAVARRPDDLQEEPVAVNDVLKEAIHFLSGQARRHRVTFISELSKDEPQILGDRGKLRQVALNLMLNGIQAMPKGGDLTIGTGIVDGSLRLTIRDNGVGIPQEKLEEIFKPFITTKASGTGLGLAVCDRIVRSFGGQISVDSQQNVGTCFELTLPTTKISENESQ